MRELFRDAAPLNVFVRWSVGRRSQTDAASVLSNNVHRRLYFLVFDPVNLVIELDF